MSDKIDAQRFVASVLVITADSNIESLLGELVAFAGYRPMYDATMGAAGESVRRARPDVVLIDTALPQVVVDACLGAAAEIGSRSVLMSSTASDLELEAQAAARGVLCFLLPGGPKPLANILARALDHQSSRPQIVLPEHRSELANASVHPALCAALASLARTSMLARASDRRSHAALRAAVTDYAKQLKAADIPIDRAAALVCDAVRDCATVVGAEGKMMTFLLESEDWARQAYQTS